MSSNRVIIVWLLIQIVPLAILYFVYNFFAEQNFFNIEGTWIGIVASGPIAAYIFITYIGFKYFKELHSIGFNLNDDLENTIVEWNFEASSLKNTKAAMLGW